MKKLLSVVLCVALLTGVYAAASAANDVKLGYDDTRNAYSKLKDAYTFGSQLEKTLIENKDVLLFRFYIWLDSDDQFLDVQNDNKLLKQYVDYLSEVCDGEGEGLAREEANDWIKVLEAILNDYNRLLYNYVGYNFSRAPEMISKITKELRDFSSSIRGAVNALS